MDRIKKTAHDIEQIIQAATPDLKDVQFQVRAEKSVRGWSARRSSVPITSSKSTRVSMKSRISLSYFMSCNKNNIIALSVDMSGFEQIVRAKISNLLVTNDGV
jgi:hypothetical protein